MRAVVEATARYRAAHGHPPSVRDLKARTGFRSTSVVWYWLRECEDGDLILRARSAHRTITLTAAGRALAAESAASKRAA